MRFPNTQPAYTAPRHAPIAPLPPDGHYLRRSSVARRISQSESSDSDASEEESAKNVSGAGSDSSDSESDRSGDDARVVSDADLDHAERASLGSRSSSESALYDSDSSQDDDASIAVHNSASSYTTSLMHVQRHQDRTMWHNDNLGVVALLIPITGISTMVVTEILACAYHFDCSKEYPTLSYAAEFKPEGHAFTIGMCATSIFILAAVVLFHWFVRLKLFHPAVDRDTVVVTHLFLVAGVIAACSLFGLAVFDMGAYHDTHIVFTVVFFISAWILMGAIQAARRKLLRDGDATKLHKAAAVSTCAQLGGASGVWFALQRWKRITMGGAYRLGRAFLCAGLTATGSFGLLFLCVNGTWPNPLGFTAVQEALLEAFAILCQLFFMGTLSCELSLLTRIVEHRDYQELERAE